MADPESKIEYDEEVAATSHDMLRAFEDKHLGPDHPRPFGKLERGSGSKFASLSPSHRAHHAAIEDLIKAEEAHGAATTAMSAADAKLDAAVKRVKESGEAMEQPQ